MTSKEQRVTDDDAHKKIEQLLENEADPHERVRLIVLMRLNDVLVDNVVATRALTTEFREHRAEFNSHQQRFDTHVINERVMIAKGRGAMWAAVALLGVIQVLGGYIVNGHLQELRTAVSLAEQNANAVALHKEEHKTLERRVVVLEQGK